MSGQLQYSSEAPLETLSKLPDPTGFRVLVAIPEVEEKTEGGIIVPDERRAAESVATIVGYVMKLGPDAYQDAKRFPGEPWCEVGDWVVMRAYSGTRIMVHGREFRIINDDSVEAVVDNPMGVNRA